MRKLSAAGQLLLLVSLGLVILGSEQRIRERAGLAGAEKKQERTEETARRYYELYENIWKDLEYFPIPQWKERELPVTFENSWLIERTYGGTRGHEGTDLDAAGEQKWGVSGGQHLGRHGGERGLAGKRRLADRHPECP
ncbi:MAG: hypothetical protein V8Q27_07420 [Eubacteriales bacterium]